MLSGPNREIASSAYNLCQDVLPRLPLCVDRCSICPTSVYWDSGSVATLPDTSHWLHFIISRSFPLDLFVCLLIPCLTNIEICSGWRNLSRDHSVSGDGLLCTTLASRNNKYCYFYWQTSSRTWVMSNVDQCRCHNFMVVSLYWA